MNWIESPYLSHVYTIVQDLHLVSPWSWVCILYSSGPDPFPEMNPTLLIVKSPHGRQTGLSSHLTTMQRLILCQLKEYLHISPFLHVLKSVGIFQSLSDSLESLRVCERGRNSILAHLIFQFSILEKNQFFHH